MDCVLLASGSKGNCIYIGNGTDAVVVDAGIGYLKRTLEEYRIKHSLLIEQYQWIEFDLEGLCAA
ncbi:MAG TPA: hypothetical protein O0X74_02475, partial [Methanocorpusculum sp.]|nr:hypothetical protein [Methanocorpusculum sp.]